MDMFKELEEMREKLQFEQEYVLEMIDSLKKSHGYMGENLLIIDFKKETYKEALEILSLEKLNAEGVNAIEIKTFPNKNRIVVVH